MISIEHLNKRFSKFQALEDINLHFEAGSSYALVGPNGSGKTTLIKCLLGLVIPTSGEIRVKGAPILGQWTYRQWIGYMPQISRFPEHMEVGQLFDLVAALRTDVSNPDWELWESFQLEKIRHKRMHTLSAGMGQKVSAALAFLHNPPILVLDEPTAGLDPVAVEVLKDKIREEIARGKLLIITSHVMSDLDELSSRLMYLFEGRVYYDDTIEALKQSTGHTTLGKAIAHMIRNQFAHQTSAT